MDVSQTNPQADDHNTNQNEATLTCGPIHSPDQLLKGPMGLKKLDNIENDLVVSDGTDQQDNNKGMCDDNDRSVDIQHAENNSVNRDVETQYLQTQLDNIVDNFQDGDVCVKTKNKAAGPLPSDSACLTTPSEHTNLNLTIALNATPNDSSAVDISMTSDEDVKVTCRLSSTPNNFSVHKTLNDTDCSMSSVDEASPIVSTIETADSKAPLMIQKTDTFVVPGNVQNPSKDHDKVDNNSMMYIQPQFYQNKQNDPRNQAIKHDYSQRCNPYYTQTPPNFQRNYSTPPPPYDYPPFVETPCGYNDYNLCSQRSLSLTDVKARQDLQQQMTLSPQPELCCYSWSSNGISDREYFVYPSIYVSNAGLISVLLRNDISVEMTVDRTIRVVSHNHMMAVATDSKGTAASLYHPAAKIFQMSYDTDIATDTFRAKMTQGEAIFFSNGVNCFKLQDSELKPMAPIKFSDIHRDQSVNLLFSSEGYGESLVATCMQVAAQAEYANLPKGGVIVRINGVKVTQSGCGDVTVVTGAKFIRLSPHNGTTRLGNRFVDIEVERDWSVKLTRGTHSFVSTKKRTMVSNGKMEAGFDENNGLKVINLQSRHPLLADPNIIRRPGGGGGKRMARTPPPANYMPSTCFTPRRRVLASRGGRGGVNTC